MYSCSFPLIIFLSNSLSACSQSYLKEETQPVVVVAQDFDSCTQKAEVGVSLNSRLACST